MTTFSAEYFSKDFYMDDSTRKHIQEIFMQKIVIIKVQDGPGQAAAYLAASALHTLKKETHDEV